MISPQAAAKLRASREGQELIDHIVRSIEELNIPVSKVPREAPDMIAINVLSRQRAIEVLGELFADLTATATPTDIRQDKEIDAGL